MAKFRLFCIRYLPLATINEISHGWLCHSDGPMHTVLLAFLLLAYQLELPSLFAVIQTFIRDVYKISRTLKMSSNSWLEISWKLVVHDPDLWEVTWRKIFMTNYQNSRNQWGAKVKVAGVRGDSQTFCTPCWLVVAWKDLQFLRIVLWPVFWDELIHFSSFCLI